jgi:hypothetical protein
MTDLNALAAQIHATAVDRGWYDTPRTFPELIALMHSELSEALEAFRDSGVVGWGPDLDGKPEGAVVELADAIIRILDACVYYHVDIHAALTAKMRYNVTRPYRHGGKHA